MQVQFDPNDPIYAHLQDGGLVASASFTPTATAYGVGDIMDVAKELVFRDRGGVAVPDGSLIRVLSSIMKIDEASVISGQTSYSLQAYSVTPPSAQADNALWALASADLTHYRGSISLGTPADLGACQYVKSQYIDTDIKLVGNSLFGQLVTAGAFTPTAVARQVLLYAVRL